jgi:hypothetical protein
MYEARLVALGGHFGQFPVSGYFWSKVDAITSPLRFVCAMSLTFENANLDHTVDYAAAARRAGRRQPKWGFSIWGGQLPPPIEKTPLSFSRTGRNAPSCGQHATRKIWI